MAEQATCYYLPALLQLHLHSRPNTWLNMMHKDSCKTGRETFKFGDLVRIILEIGQYVTVTAYIMRDFLTNIPLVALYEAAPI